MVAPSVSVVIPTYNRAPLVARAIRSVLLCLEPGDEVIVVDDGSTDDTPQVVGAADAPWRGVVRYIRVENGGAGRARNIGMREARHELVAFLDSDDEWLRDGLAPRRALMSARPDVVFCMSDFSLLERDGRVVPGGLLEWTHDRRPWSEILGPAVAYSSICTLAAGQQDFRVHFGSLYRPMFGFTPQLTSYVGINTALVRRDGPAKAIQFPEDVPTYEDWEFFGRLSHVGTCAYLDVSTAAQRSHDGPRLTGLPVLTRAQARLHIVERLWGQDPGFMREHGRQVREVMDSCKRRIVRELIKLNRRDEARDWLERTDSAWLEHAFMWIPQPVLRLLGRTA
jgi:glycosyltransferase involved in cell wall biosynthesis